MIIYLIKNLQTDTKKISAVSIFFETMPCRLNESTGYIDYDQVVFISFRKLNVSVAILSLSFPKYALNDINFSQTKKSYNFHAFRICKSRI